MPAEGNDEAAHDGVWDALRRPSCAWVAKSVCSPIALTRVLSPQPARYPNTTCVWVLPQILCLGILDPWGLASFREERVARGSADVRLTAVRL